MTWEFTPDEFMYVWAETGQDRYPFPLQLMSSVRWEDEYERLHSELRNRLPAGGDPDLSAALRVAAAPESTLALTGTRKRPLRAFGAIAPGVGVTVVQRPGPTAEFGGNVVVEVGSPAIVVTVFTAVLGNVPAGQRPALIESTDRIRLSLESWTGTQESTTDRMRALLRAPRSGAGHVEVRHQLHSPRPHPAQYLSWFDVEGDGRYLHRERFNDFHIEPCPSERLRRELTAMIQVRQDFPD
ncbi:hypothetical protein C5E44_34385 [Nocardia nova]|uniref:ESX secretion-associated protein EspG n=1 Tax=Nocardia nova TaxID=37330 RepID=UPI000CEA3EB7|nr:hypothetical protein C5E44_34385 [Nocardia nova]